ncbi:MAG: class B sortase [Defluviitaleaceae bacterium]|nr:class B sortase [Defluviitaleaceae bacterium]
MENQEQAAALAALEATDRQLEGLKRKKRTTPEKMPWFTAAVLFVLCVLSLGTGIYYWYNTYFRPAGEAQVVEAALPLQGLPVVALADEEPSLAHEYIAAYEAEYAETYVEYEVTSEELYEESPSPSSEIFRPLLDPRPQFIQLWEYFGNNEIAGHLFIQGTELDVYVMQAMDNNFYRSHDIYGNQNEGGWPFICYTVDILMLNDFNTVIFGADGSVMQQVLRQYYEYDFFLAHPVIDFNSLYRSDEWEIFSFYVAPGNVPFAVVSQPYEYWGEMADMFTIASLYNTRLDVTEYDQLLTLTTPASGGGGLYYVLQARLLRHITS